eukprot:IDg21232t1
MAGRDSAAGPSVASSTVAAIVVSALVASVDGDSVSPKPASVPVHLDSDCVPAAVLVFQCPGGSASKRSLATKVLATRSQD